MTFTLALQSLVNVGVRGSEQIRTRVVEAGVLGVAAEVMRSYLDARTAAAASDAVVVSSASDISLPLRQPTPRRPLRPYVSSSRLTVAPPTRTSTPDAIAGLETDDADADPSDDPDLDSDQPSAAALARVRSDTRKLQADEDAAMDVDADPQTERQHLVRLSVPEPLRPPGPTAPAFQFRDDDVLMCLQLLAYLSKYPHVRAVFHAPDGDAACGSTRVVPGSTDAPATLFSRLSPAERYAHNLFSLVERFTFRPSPADRAAPRFATEIAYWCVCRSLRAR